MGGSNDAQFLQSVWVVYMAQRSCRPGMTGNARLDADMRLPIWKGGVWGLVAWDSLVPCASEGCILLVAIADCMRCSKGKSSWQEDSGTCIEL